jgi:Ca2+/Na+ antiporter
MYAARYLQSIFFQIVAVFIFLMAINDEFEHGPKWLWIVFAVFIYLVFSWREYRNEENFNEERKARISYYRRNS